MMSMRKFRSPALGAVASLAGFLCLAVGAPAVSAQVLGSTPYAPAPDPMVLQLQTRIDALEADLRKATGRAEQLSFELTQVRRAEEEAKTGRMEAEKTIEQLNARIATLEGGGAASPQGLVSAPAGPEAPAAPADIAAPAAPAQPSIDVASLPADETGLMKEARNLLLAGDYPSAQQAFTVYLDRYGKGEGAGEAQYLLGESLLYQENYADAAEAYVKLISTYKTSARAPEGLVKLARAMRLMGEKGEACKVLGQMSSKYPKASAAAKTLAATERQRAGC
jgi:tol-pal system protein YbgF